MKHRWVQQTLSIPVLECSHHRFLLISSGDIEWSVTLSHRIPYTSSWTHCYHTYAYLHKMYMASVASNMYPERAGPGPVSRSPCSMLSAWLPCHHKLILIHDNIQDVRFRLPDTPRNAGLPVVNTGLPVFNIDIVCGSCQAFHYVPPPFLSKDRVDAFFDLFTPLNCQFGEIWAHTLHSGCV